MTARLHSGQSHVTDDVMLRDLDVTSRDVGITSEVKAGGRTGPGDGGMTAVRADDTMTSLSLHVGDVMYCR